MTEKTYPNTFAPHIGNKEFTLEQIRLGIKLSFLSLKMVPKELLDLAFPKTEQ